MRTETIKCDRCGKELDNDSAYKIDLPYVGLDKVYGYALGGRKLLTTYEYKCLNLISQDLCKQCMEELVDWMGEKEKV